jgi:2-hydroxy-3-keto-5-methylthiopentenyl-1-phosphate phosphatase
MKQNIFVTDFDGTLARNDFYRLVRERLLPPDTPDYWSEFVHGKLTHFEVLRRYFGDIRATEADVDAVVQDMGVDPRFPELAAELAAQGWSIIIASAGCDWYIRRLLVPLAVPVTIYSNPGEWRGECEGLVMSLPEHSPFYSPTHGVDKSAIVADALTRAELVAFAGDGIPDADAAALVSPRFRFARADCAAQLAARGEPFRLFDRWSEVAEALLSEV